LEENRRTTVNPDDTFGTVFSVNRRHILSCDGINCLKNNSKETTMETTLSKNGKTISRRDFLKTGIATGAALAAVTGLSACAPNQQQDSDGSSSSSSITVGGIPETWDYTTEILVVGGGGGGMVAACKAKELGAEVLLIEKADSVGGDTIISSQAAQGFWEGHVDEGDSIELYLEDLKNSHWATEKGIAGEPLASDFPLTRAWLEAASAMYDWTEEHGMAWFGYTTIREAWYPQPQWDTKTTRQWVPSGGSLMGVMNSIASDLDLEILTKTYAYGLILGEDGRVIGAHAFDEKDRPITIKATKSVILTCGGFNANRALMKRYLAIQGTGYCGGCDNNTGDGALMVQAIGGKLNDMSLSTHWMVYDDISPTTIYNAATGAYGGTDSDPTALDFPFILVNLNGERFMAETMGYKWVGYHTNNQPYHVNYIFFDSGEACNNWFAAATGQQTHENSTGTGVSVLEYETLDEIAKAMEVPADALKDTVERYNGFVENDKDDDFGRMLRKVSKLETSPYHAIRMAPRHYTTYGGIAIDTGCHVLKSDGSAIPGLYAAGTCCGAIVEQEGLYYQGGVGQTMTQGYMAAEAAVAEQTWE
jgi:fumarate reductase flavoprotein subunit